MTAIKLTKPSTFPTLSKIIPKREQWLWQNPQALASVLKGIHQAAEGNVQKLGSLGQSANVKMDVLRCVN
jgi:hypothetical protein